MLHCGAESPGTLLKVFFEHRLGVERRSAWVYSRQHHGEGILKWKDFRERPPYLPDKYQKKEPSV